jgi:hypothetical protein
MPTLVTLFAESLIIILGVSAMLIITCYLAGWAVKTFLNTLKIYHLFFKFMIKHFREKEKVNA